MALYSYQGITREGKKTKGQVDAPSEAGAKELLNKKGIFPTSIIQAKEYTQKITVKEEEKDNESPEKIDSIKNIIESTKSKFTDITHIIIEKINKVTSNE